MALVEWEGFLGLRPWWRGAPYLPIGLWVALWVLTTALCRNGPSLSLPPGHCCPASICWWTLCPMNSLSVLFQFRWGLRGLFASFAPELSGVIASWLTEDSVSHLNSSMKPTPGQPWSPVGSPASTISDRLYPCTDHVGPSVSSYYTKDKGTTRELDSGFLSTYPSPTLTFILLSCSKLGIGEHLVRCFQTGSGEKLFTCLPASALQPTDRGQDLFHGVPPLSLPVSFLLYTLSWKGASVLFSSPILYSLSLSLFQPIVKHKSSVKPKILLWTWEFPFLLSIMYSLGASF